MTIIPRNTVMADKSREISFDVEDGHLFLNIDERYQLS